MGWKRSAGQVPSMAIRDGLHAAPRQRRGEPTRLASSDVKARVPQAWDR
jgi:hypothetical protein